MRNFSVEMKVGIFAIIIIAILSWTTIKVGDSNAVGGSGYDLSVDFDNATGLKPKAPVELAGVKVGVVKKIRLVDSRRAHVTLLLAGSVHLTDDTKAVLRTRGFLGETYVEIIPGNPDSAPLNEGGDIKFSARTGDVNSLVSQFNSIAGDIKHITSSLRGMIGKQGDYPVNRIVDNLDKFTAAIKKLTLRNSGNIDRISENLAAMTDQLREMVKNSGGHVEESADRIASITRKIDEGKGTIGRLVNDESTVDKLNSAVDNLNEALGGFKTLKMELGYHTEYLARSGDFKHYVDFSLKPSPDKALLLGIVSNPNPRPSHVERTTDVTVGGATTTVSTDISTVDHNKMRFTAELAKKFYNLTLRGGLIESSGGVGLDYSMGPLTAHASAFDFYTRYGERPHLKAGADLNVTPNLYITGGADDIINRGNDYPDWFFGAGIKFADDDFKRYMSFGGKSLMK